MMLNPEEINILATHAETSLGRKCSILGLEPGASVKIDLLCLGPTKDDPCWRFITLGMSARKMNRPEGLSFPDRLELMIALPKGYLAHWQESDELIKNLDGEEWRAVRYMLEMAHFAHDEGAFFSIGSSYGHPDDTGGPASGFPGAIVGMNSAAPKVLLNYKRHDEEAGMISAVIPLTKEELSFKINRSRTVGQVPMHLHESGVTEIFDASRESSIKKRKLFGIF